MAAMELFEEYLRALPADERDRQREMIAECRTELLAARSEEARVRRVQEFQRALATMGADQRKF